MELPSSVIEQFKDWLKDAADAGVQEPTAMTLATVNADARPSARTVLLKDYDADGFVFYTNTTSRKGQQLAANSHVALLFHWQPLQRQVLIEGDAEPVSAELADAYWATRPRESQLGGWASLQSQELPERATLDERFKEYDEKFRDKPVPRPPYWSGYRVKPIMLEFWVGRVGRMHERDRYTLDGNGWRHALFYP